MITRLVSSRLPVMAYHPPKVCDTAYMQALDRAGALPILDSEFLTNTEIIQTLDHLSGMDLLFGLRLPVANQALVDYLDRNPLANLELIVFTYRTQDELQRFRFDNRDYKFALELVDIKLDQEIERIAPHGLIVKGMEAPGRVSRNSAFIILQWYLENLDLPVFVHGGVGRHTAAGLFAMGAHGVVLDNQLYLAE
nr:hypothetical protein [Desulfobacterales bacterium]